MSWEIRDGSGELWATGPTEGEAWIALLLLEGKYFCGRDYRADAVPGRDFFGWIATLKGLRYRAIEVR